MTTISDQVVSYDSLAAGLALVLAGGKVQYSGAAGNYVLSLDGDSIENRATIWQIIGNTFHNIDSEQCSDAEVYPGYKTPP